MAKPLVAIVGRPNVGKSMLFNKLVGRRLSIVEDTPGVTRDRLYAECEWRGRTFDIVDTGGIEPGTTTEILSFMRKQAEIAIQNATVIVFLCDIKTGLTASDQDVANMLLRSRKPVILAVNKMDQTTRISMGFLLRPGPHRRLCRPRPRHRRPAGRLLPPEEGRGRGEATSLKVAVIAK